jgi:hypothetical protein
MVNLHLKDFNYIIYVNTFKFETMLIHVNLSKYKTLKIVYPIIKIIKRNIKIFIFDFYFLISDTNWLVDFSL